MSKQPTDSLFKQTGVSEKEMETIARGPISERCVICQGNLTALKFPGTKQCEFEYRFQRHMACAKDTKSPDYDKFIKEWNLRMLEAKKASIAAKKMKDKIDSGEVKVEPKKIETK